MFGKEEDNVWRINLKKVMERKAGAVVRKAIGHIHTIGKAQKHVYAKHISHLDKMKNEYRITSQKTLT